MTDHELPGRNDPAAAGAAEIAALVAQYPDLAVLFEIAREIAESDPAVLPRVVEYARRLCRGEY